MTGFLSKTRVLTGPPLWGCPQHRAQMHRCIDADLQVLTSGFKETANRHLSDSTRFPSSKMVGDTGIEPVTSCVSCKRANQLRQSP